jgi:hypothetical protein
MLPIINFGIVILRAMVDLFNVIGGCGVVLVMSAYTLIQTGKVRADQFIFPALNFFGTLLILVSLLKHWSLPAVIQEVLWLWISAYGMFMVVLKNEKTKK